MALSRARCMRDACARSASPACGHISAVRIIQPLKSRRAPCLASVASNSATHLPSLQTTRHADYALHAGPSSLRHFFRFLHSQTRRQYATQTTLPAHIDERRPPPPLLPQQQYSDLNARPKSRQWLPEHESMQVDRKQRNGKGKKRAVTTQSQQKELELAGEDLWFHVPSVRIVPDDLTDIGLVEAYNRADQDSEGNYPMVDEHASSATAPMVQEVANSVLRSAAPVQAQISAPKIVKIKPRKALSHAECIEADLELLQPSKWAAANGSATVRLSNPEVTFDLFRGVHRSKMWESEYLPSHTIPHREADTTSQPHEAPLTSRYDWRLTSPSTSVRHRAIYGQRHIWRKKQPQPSPTTDASMHGYIAYKDKYSRFIRLERKEAEEAALQRLKKRAGQTWTTGDARVGCISGLLAEVHRQYPAKHRRLETSLLSSTDSTRAMDDVEVAAMQDALEYDQDSLEQLDTKLNDGQSTLISFYLPQHADLPNNDFHKGKMVFIWQCLFESLAQRWSVPQLEDPALAWQDIKDVPVRAYVKRAYANRIDVSVPGIARLPGSGASHYRLDVGYDDTSFMRMQAALEEGLPIDTARQRNDNNLTSKGPHKTHRDIQLQGTEIRDVILKDFSQRGHEEECPNDERQQGLYLRSETLMVDQRLASWAKRYARNKPIRMDGDPDLRLNDTQLRAVAISLLNRVSLIQGPPGTGKTATIVSALILLKKCFAIAPPVLLCAHTNVAVDLLTAKCVENGLVPLRFGIKDRIRGDLSPYSFHQRFAEHRQQPRLSEAMADEVTIDDDLEHAKSLFRMTGTGTNMFEASTKDARQEEARLRKLKKRIAQLETRLAKARMKIVQIHKQMQSDLIESSDVCLSTCIGATSWTMATADFPIVFIDEAGQCDEPTSLVPLMKGARHVALIGDHKQLPSVANSDIVRREKLNMSLFERLMHGSTIPSVQLDVQYRMFPTISAFPNQMFYQGTIRDGQDRVTAEAACSHDVVTFIHHDGPEQRVQLSLANVQECEIILQLVQKVLTGTADGLSPRPLSSIGVISAYAAQTSKLREKAKEVFGKDADDLEIATVDGFQGREKDVIFLSTVRSNDAGNIGFLSDPRRLNVALTRAKYMLTVVGNAQTLSRISPWSGSNIFAEYVKWARKDSLVRRWQTPASVAVDDRLSAEWVV